MQERDPEIVAFERSVRRGAVIGKMQWFYRRMALNRSAKALWFRAILARRNK